MLATPVDEPFDGPDWLFEIKWDGYRGDRFHRKRQSCGWSRAIRTNSRQRYPELKDLPKFVKAKTAILDGEVVALDEQGRASFSLMQQRTGFRPGGKRAAVRMPTCPCSITPSICSISMATIGAKSRSRSARRSWRRCS